MICSEAKLAANRANALKSTGPRTEEGKARSRANALKHGLCASVVVVEDPAMVQRRAIEMFDTLKPQNEFHCWLVEIASITTIRLDRNIRMERRVRDKVSLRAALTWDDDRRLDAERLGRRLAERPGEVVEELRRTPQGCDWLLTRWAMLAHAADKNQAWTAGQARLAFQLLGTPSEFRDDFTPGLALDLDGVVLADPSDPASVARREIALLKEHKAVVADLDEAERSLTEADLTNESDAELRRLRRYENGLHRRLRWALAELRVQSPYRLPDASLRPNYQIDSVPDLKPERPHPDEVAAANHPKNSWSPPFDLDPDEVPPTGQKPDLPVILQARRIKRLAKAEARRQVKRRKMDQLHA